MAPIRQASRPTSKPPHTAAAAMVPELAEEALRRGQRLIPTAADNPDRRRQRAALAHVAIQGALRGQN